MLLMLSLASIAVSNPFEHVALWYIDRFALHFDSTSCHQALDTLPEYSEAVELTTASGTKYMSDGYTYFTCFASPFVNSVDFILRIEEVSTIVFSEGPFALSDEGDWHVGEDYFERSAALSSGPTLVAWLYLIGFDGFLAVVIE